MTETPAIDNLVPHEAPMVWLDELLGWEPGRARCRAVVHEGSPFVRDGFLPSALLLEHMAQAVAACLGYGALRSGKGVRVGMVVACRRFELFGAGVPVGAELVVEARSVREVDNISLYACVVESAGIRLAEAELTLYHASRPPEG